MNKNKQKHTPLKKKTKKSQKTLKYTYMQTQINKWTGKYTFTDTYKNRQTYTGTNIHKNT